MADFLWAVLKLAVFQGLLVELLKVGMQKSAWRALSALKSFLLLVGIWLALQVFIAALLIWPIHAVQETQSLLSALALSVVVGLLVLGLQRLWPNWALLEQDVGNGWPSVDASSQALVFWRSASAGLGLLLLALPALLVQVSWAFGSAESNLYLLGYGILSLLMHVLALQLKPVLQSAHAEQPQQVATEKTQANIDPDMLLLQSAYNGQVDEAIRALQDGANAHQLPHAGAKDQRSLMMIASSLSDLRLLRVLISHGVDLNVFHAGLNPLLSATRDSWHGRSEAVTMLLTNGAHTHVADADGNTPLHHAMRSTDAAVAALLLDAGADKEAVNNENCTPLALACQAANWRIARYMLERKAKVEPEHAEPVLIAAAGAEDDEIGIRLLHKYKAKIDIRDSKQRTPLMVAAQAGLLEVVSVLLELGAQINTQDEAGQSAYMLAAQAGEVEVLKKLQEAPKLNRAAADVLGKTALDYALANGRWMAVACIDPSYPLPEHLSREPEPSSQNSGLQQLHHALSINDLSAAEQLLQLGIAASPEDLADLVFSYSQLDNRATLAWLLQRGGHLFGRNAHGQTVYQRLLLTSQNQTPVLNYFLSKAQSISGTGTMAAFLESCLRNDFSRRSDEQQALLLLQQGADPFCGTWQGRSPPIVLAIRLGWQRLSQALLALGADANAADGAGLCALHFAAQLGRGNLLQELIAYGANPELRANNGQTPLGLALLHGNPDCIRWLTWAVWPLPLRTLRGCDLPGAVLANDMPAVSKLLTIGVSVNGHDQKGSTALIHACGHGQLDLVRLLLKHGADSGLVAIGGATALWAAISQAHGEVLEQLLMHGADANQLVAGYPPLNLACLTGLPEQVSLLLEYGAEPAAEDSQGHNALHACAVYLSSEKARLDAMILVDSLIRAGVAVDYADKHGQTPMHLLCGASLQKGQILKEGLVLSALDRLLLESPAVDAIDSRGFTALHHAAARGYRQLAERLLRAGADRNRRDNLGRSAYDFAVMGGFAEAANLLQDKPERIEIAHLLNKNDPT